MQLITVYYVLLNYWLLLTPNAFGDISLGKTTLLQKLVEMSINRSSRNPPPQPSVNIGNQLKSKIT